MLCPVNDLFLDRNKRQKKSSKYYTHNFFFTWTKMSFEVQKLHFYQIYLVKKTLKNHISLVMYLFHINDGYSWKFSSVRTLTHCSIGGKGTLIKNYELITFLKLAYQKSWWQMTKSDVCHLRPGFDPRSRQFSLFYVLLQNCRFSPFFILVLFTLLSNLKGRRKKRVVTMVISFQKSSIKKLLFLLKCNIHFVRHWMPFKLI